MTCCSQAHKHLQLRLYLLQPVDREDIAGQSGSVWQAGDWQLPPVPAMKSTSNGNCSHNAQVSAFPVAAAEQVPARCISLPGAVLQVFPHRQVFMHNVVLQADAAFKAIRRGE